MAMEPVIAPPGQEMLPTEVEQPTDEQPDSNEDVLKQIKNGITLWKQEKKELIPDWNTNIDYRRGKNSDSDSDTNRLPVTVDWSQTKAKIAQIFSQIPQVIATTDASSVWKPFAGLFQKRLNYRVKKAGMGSAMDECMSDLVNAAGFCALIVNFETRQQPKKIPIVDVSQLGLVEQLQYKLGLKKMEYQTVPYITDRRFSAMRISPDDFLKPPDFTGSDFDQADWLGHTGHMTWAVGKNRFKLDDSLREKVCGDDRTSQEMLSTSNDKKKADNDHIVLFDEIFYWRYRFHADEPSYTAIQHVVFLKGLEKPVVNEPWKGQRIGQDGAYLGACRLPIRVATLVYISGEAIPPSDSAICRPLVDEKIESRNDQRLQRKHSVPVRWFDVNRVDPDIQTNLQDGDWQGMIPVNGDGTRVIGEVARATMSRDNMEFDRTLEMEIGSAWQAGPGQNGTLAASGEHPASEFNIAQQNFQTRVGKERQHGVDLFLGAVDVLAGLMCLYDDFDLSTGASQQDVQILQQLDPKQINHELVFTIRPDSTVLLDSEQRFSRLHRLYNIGAQSGVMDPYPLLEEMTALTQVDPSTVMIKPKPKAPDQPNISFRFSGAADLMHPLSLATLMKAGQAPTKEELAAAYELLGAVQAGGSPPLAPVPAVPGEPVAGAPITAPDIEHPELTTADRVEKRSNERGAQ